MTSVFAPIMAVTLGLAASAAQAADLKLGIVGTDTSHVVAFTRLLSDPSSPDHIPGARIVAAYKGGSPDLAPSRDRIDGFTRELQEKFGVEIVGTIAELCKRVDGVLLESVDGRSHLAQAREVISAGKPLFSDKPLAATLDDAREIARLAKHAGVAWFSTSSLRYAVANLKSANLSGADVWGPGPLEEHHQLDLSWYAIHAIEMLYALMGTGCEQVTRISTPGGDVVTGLWKNGKTGTVRTLRPYGGYGALVFRPKQVIESDPKASAGYRPLLVEIIKFFETKQPPVSNEETLEIFAFMDAAQRSKDAGAQPMKLR